MNSSGNERHARAVRDWELAILRFALTLDDADRLAVLTIAREIDDLAPPHAGKPDFGFFRRTSATLCATLLQPDEPGCTNLRQFLARIDDDRLKRAFAAALEIELPKPSAGNAVHHDPGLWKGLSPRSTIGAGPHPRKPADIPRLSRPKAG
jgi:hypothetical protein